MSRTLPLVAAALSLLGCAGQAAKMLATGINPTNEVRSVTSVEEARQSPEGTIRLVLVVKGHFELWYLPPDPPRGFFDVRVPASGDAPIRIRREDFKHLGNRRVECWGDRMELWPQLGAELVDPPESPVGESRLEDQRILIRNSGGVIRTVEFEPAPPGHPIAWPLVPLGYAIDVPLVAAGAAATLALVGPLELLTRLVGGPSPPDPCELPN